MPHEPASSQVDALNRALSPFELVFWRLAQAGSLNVTTTATVHGHLSEESLSAGLHQLRLRHPFLRVRICDQPGLPRYVSADVPEVPLRVLSGSTSDGRTILEEEINKPIDAERGPLVRCTWIRRDETAHHLLITFHHVIGDGMSGVYLMRDLVQAAAAHMTGRAAPLSPLADSLPMDLRLPRQARGPRGAWGQARFVARVAWDDLRLRPPARPRPDQPAPLAARWTRLICRELDPTTVERLANKARDHGTTIQGALSAAICLATANDHSSTSAMSVKHRSPVNMRQLLEPPVGKDVGLFASMAFYRGRVKAGDDFWSLAREIRSSIKSQIDQGVPAVLIGMLPRLYRMLRGDRLAVADFGAQWQRRTPSTTGLTNLGRVSLTGEFEPLEISALHFAVSPGGLGDSSCTATTYAGWLRWNFLFASPLFAEDRAQRITSDAVERLETAISD